MGPITLRSSLRFALVAACLVAGGCALRAPGKTEVQAVSVSGGTLEQRQQRTGIAYRQLQQVRYEKKLAEQDLLNARAAYERSRQIADEAKAQMDKAAKAYAAAQAREKEAEQGYEAAMRSVDELYGAGTKSEQRPR